MQNFDRGNSIYQKQEAEVLSDTLSLSLSFSSQVKCASNLNGLKYHHPLFYGQHFLRPNGKVKWGDSQMTGLPLYGSN